MGGGPVATATPQTMLSIGDVMAEQNQMRLGGGGLRRRGVELVLWGEIKVHFVNH